MKNKIALGITSLFIALGVFALRSIGNVSAVTDSCTGIETTFTANFPQSVVAGKPLTLSNITSKPSTSFGVTVTSSTLNLSASNASPATYSQQDTSTDPSPTTGASTYTAFYPNWTLTASGSAGSTITVKLTQITANVDGIGPITCPLSATLATINITAPSTSGGSSSSKPGTTTKTSTPPPTTTTETKKDPTTDTQTTKMPTDTDQAKLTTAKLSAQAVQLNILVIDSKKHLLKGAKVTIDGQLSAKTGSKGTTSFSGIRQGDHELSVVYGNKKISQKVQASLKNKDQTITVIMPLASNILGLAMIGLGSGLIVFILGFLVFKKLRKPKVNMPITSPPVPSARTDQTQTLTN